MSVELTTMLIVVSPVKGPPATETFCGVAQLEGVKVKVEFKTVHVILVEVVTASTTLDVGARVRYTGKVNVRPRVTTILPGTTTLSAEATKLTKRKRRRGRARSKEP
jgi:hypothetical protein